MGTIIFALVLLGIVIACCIYSKNHKNVEEPVEEECVLDTSQIQKPTDRPRDAKGRFIKKTDSQ